MSKIAYIGGMAGFVGGIERYAWATSQVLRRHGHQVRFYGSGEKGREAELFESGFDAVAPLGSSWEEILDSDFIVLHKILPEPDLARLPVERTCFIAHDHQIYCRRHHYYTIWGRRNCHRAYHPLRCWCCALGRNSAPPLAAMRRFKAVVLSNFMRQNLIKNGFSPERVYKIRPFVPEVQVASAPRKFAVDGKLHLLFIGQLIRGKGADLLLKMVRKLTIPFELTIVGMGKDLSYLQRLTQRYHLTEKVKFTYYQRDPEKFFASSDLLIFPARWQEPFGLVGVEALSHGVPVLGFATGGAGEWLRDGVTGRALPERDWRAGTRELNSIYAQLDQLAFWSANGLKLVQAYYLPHRFVAEFEKLMSEESL